MKEPFYKLIIVENSIMKHFQLISRFEADNAPKKCFIIAFSTNRHVLLLSTLIFLKLENLLHKQNVLLQCFYIFCLFIFRFQIQIINKMTNMIKMIHILIRMVVNNNVINMMINHVINHFHFEIIFQMKISKCKMAFIPK